MRHRSRAAIALPVLALSAALALSGCSSGGVQRELPGTAQSSSSVGPEGTDFSVQGRNVDLRITQAAVRLGTTGGAQLQMGVDNAGPVTEHLALAAVEGKVATLDGTANNAKSTAGVLIASGTTASFGAADGPKIVLTNGAALKVGGTVPVMLQFGIAGMVRIDVPVLN
ncbi:hypothetical protein DN069_03035 [Streptacidiphilus pinicola]|uniref:Lipoprotein n=1 Tax=Streptacidiphilus pinicola TaxID=2219663 RepID=A0A2X0ITZ5_9ACTN|nr:hypothetical protein [Streptacidiphilus pinicola]RAG87103.1 hypothetical protein DN069_03035 [Streptacidiphilus pinicola]